MNTLRFGEKPAEPQVQILPTGMTAFTSMLAAHAPQVLATLTHRPRGLATLPPPTRNGLATALRDLRAQIDATLRDLEAAPAARPAFDPLPPTPTPQPQTVITK